MNTERLYEVLQKLTSEVGSIGILDALEDLKNQISSQVNDPSNADHQTQFFQSLESLRSVMSDTWLTELTPLESDLLEKMDLALLVGHRLPNRITSLMRESGMLPAVVRDEIVKIDGRLKKGIEDAEATINDFRNLGLDDTNPLGPGVGELALRIPRSFIDQNYSSFIEDAEFLKDLVTTSVELIEGQHDDLVLRSLASSDYGIFLQVAPSVVAFTVLAIERIMAGYKTLLEIRVLHDELKERNTPTEVLKAIEADVENRINEIARKGVEDALKQYKSKATKERRNELINLAEKLFRKLLEKLENDYDLDGRVGHSEEIVEDAEEQAQHQQFATIDSQVRKGIRAVRKQIRESKNLKALGYEPEEQDNPGDDAENGASE